MVKNNNSKFMRIKNEFYDANNMCVSYNLIWRRISLKEILKIMIQLVIGFES
jgi:hypothetical protein